MNYTQFKAWLAKLRADNENREDVIANIGRIEKLLTQPLDVFTIPTIHNFLLSLIRLDAAERITYPKETAGMVYEEFRKVNPQKDFTLTDLPPI